MKLSRSLVILGFVSVVCHGEAGQLDENVESAGNSANSIGTKGPLMIHRTSDAVVNLANFADLLEPDDEIVDITRFAGSSDIGTDEADKEKIDESSSGDDTTTEQEEPQSETLITVGAGTKTAAVPESTDTSATPEDNFTTSTLLTPAMSTTLPHSDDFSDFIDSTSFRDISMDDERIRTHKEAAPTVTVPLPNESMHWTVVPDKSTMLDKTFIKGNSPNKRTSSVVRYFVKFRNESRSAADVAPATTATSDTFFLHTVAPTTEVSLSEPIVTIPLPEEALGSSEEIDEARIRFSMSSPFQTSSSLVPTTADGSFSMYTFRSGTAAKAALPLSTATFASLVTQAPRIGTLSSPVPTPASDTTELNSTMRPPSPLPSHPNADLISTEPIPGQTSKAGKASSPDQKRISHPSPVSETSPLHEQSAQPIFSPHLQPSILDEAPAQLPLRSPSQQSNVFGKNPLTPFEEQVEQWSLLIGNPDSAAPPSVLQSGLLDEETPAEIAAVAQKRRQQSDPNDVPVSVATARGKAGKAASVTRLEPSHTTLQPVETTATPKGVLRRRTKPSLVLLPTQVPSHDLWWTPPPGYLENKIDVSSQEATTVRGNRRKTKKIRNSVRQAGSGRGSSSLVPLARASAVGHYSYTTTIPPEFTTSVSVEEASAENVGPKKLEQLAVPEGHLQQLISELEVLSGSESAKPVIPISTVSLPMRYGKHRRRISFMKQKDGKRVLPMDIYPNRKLKVAANEMTKNNATKWTSFKLVSPPQPRRRLGRPHVKKVYREPATVSATDDSQDADAAESTLHRRVKGVSTAVPPLPASASGGLFNIALHPVNAITSQEASSRNAASLPSMGHNAASADLSELEEALREIAFMSNGKNIDKSSESMSYNGDYSDRPAFVDGAVERHQRRRRRKEITFEQLRQKEASNQETISTGQRKVSKMSYRLTRDQGNAKPSLPIIPPPPPLDAELMSSEELRKTSMEELIALIKRDSNQTKNSPNADVCAVVTCDFEKGDLCGFVSSNSADRPVSKNHRFKKSALSASAYFVIRGWRNWVGRHYNTFRRVDKGPVFGPANRHFAASLLTSQQMATLTLKTRTSEPFALFFDSWEATREMQLRVCCDDVCPLTTYFGFRNTDRVWRRLALQCPASTSLVTFECMNFGGRRGACGIDNFVLRSRSCTNQKL